MSRSLSRPQAWRRESSSWPTSRVRLISSCRELGRSPFSLPASLCPSSPTPLLPSISFTALPSSPLAFSAPSLTLLMRPVSFLWVSGLAVPVRPAASRLSASPLTLVRKPVIFLAVSGEAT